MNKVSVPAQPGSSAADGACHPIHQDWAELTEHLIDRFRSLSDTAVISEVVSARNSIEGFHLTGSDQLSTAEIMARHALIVLVERQQSLADEADGLDLADEELSS